MGIHHIIICGHYGCGGVAAAMGWESTGLVNYWTRFIKDIYSENQLDIETLGKQQEKVDLLCELNVSQQVQNVGYTSIVQQAWKKGKSLTIHGWIYSEHDGLLKNLDLCASNNMQLKQMFDKFKKRKDTTICSFLLKIRERRFYGFGIVAWYSILHHSVGNVFWVEPGIFQPDKTPVND